MEVNTNGYSLKRRRWKVILTLDSIDKGWKLILTLDIP